MNDRNYGAVASLPERLAYWRERMGSDRLLPWAGLGLCADVTAAKREADNMRAVRAFLVDRGFLSPDDTETDVVSLIGILLG